MNLEPLEEQVASAQSRDVLDLAIALLGEEKRRVVIARYWEGLDATEISGALGITQRRVWRLEAAALRDLRSMLGTVRGALVA